MNVANSAPLSLSDFRVVCYVLHHDAARFQARSANCSVGSPIRLRGSSEMSGLKQVTRRIFTMLLELARVTKLD
jgi:hypothetical protein